eukprot:scaffold23188_cov42-Cyclotella_meneghiniana.AAC.6
MSVGHSTTKKFTVVAKDIAARDGSNILTVQEQDTIHVVDIDSNQVLYRDVDSDGDYYDTTPSTGFRMSPLPTQQQHHIPAGGICVVQGPTVEGIESKQTIESNNTMQSIQ